MTEQQQDDSGDYGYDMAHEQTRPPPAPDHPKPQRHATAHAGGSSDQGEDYSYDEAHGF